MEVIAYRNNNIVFQGDKSIEQITLFSSNNPNVDIRIVNEISKPSFTDSQYLSLVYVKVDEPHPIYSDFLQVNKDWEIKNYTAEELEIVNQTEQDNDQASEFFDNRIEFGKTTIERFSAFIYRKVINSEITKAQAVSAMEFFYDALQPLNNGYIELSRKRLNALVTANQELLDLKIKILSEIDDFLANE